MTTMQRQRRLAKRYPLVPGSSMAILDIQLVVLSCFCLYSMNIAGCFPPFHVITRDYDLVQGVAMSTPAVMPFRSLVQTPTFPSPLRALLPLVSHKYSNQDVEVWKERVFPARDVFSFFN